MVVAASTILSLFGCAESSAPTRPGLAELKGSLTLTGVLRDPTGATTGTRVVTDPSGIRVYLTRSGTVVDSALTVAGT